LRGPAAVLSAEGATYALLLADATLRANRVLRADSLALFYNAADADLIYDNGGGGPVAGHLNPLWVRRIRRTG
jgi:hypothetical protein